MGKRDKNVSSSSHNNWSETEFNWIGAQLPPVDDDAVPRSQPHVDHITQGVQGINIGQSDYGGGQQYTHQSQQGGVNYGAVDPSQSHLPADSIGASDSSSPSIYTHNAGVERAPSIGKWKGKARADDQQHVNSGAVLMQGDIHPIDPGYGLSGGGYGGGGAANVTGSATYRSPYSEQFGGLYGTVEGDAPVDGGFDQAVAESRSHNFGRAHPGEASSYDIEPAAYDQPTVDPNTYSYAEDEEVDEGTITPRGHTSSVLKILWSEPRGAANSRFSEWEIKTTDAGPFYVGYRRFIVVRSDEGHSTCIPISTYEGKACTKNGVRASKHGIVYELSRHKGPPRLLKKEPELGFEPVALEIYAPNEKLQLESRVNYSKLVTIEHNVKVFFIGRVAQQHLDYVQNAVNECWSKKRTERSTRKHRK
ncbi:hypothetical protein DL764_005567 [Monosporascus ibericus]|uniref:DUF6590 domain-containing protein n=1 Tax=Monosporascus ibericus TaxID=155417 RepID=A0A4Q4TC13_9PEZI|nr:hypothetical protein DL764_005567 [Monosporascus ibericus]